MNVKNVAFSGGLHIDKSMSPAVKDAVKNSSAIKYFGKFYNADISQTQLYSGTKKGVIYSGLGFDNIKPKNIFVALYDLIKGHYVKSCCSNFNFNSGRKSENGLIEVLSKIDKKHIIKSFRKEMF